MARACERGFRGYIVPGPTSYPNLRGLGRVQVSALSLGIAPRGVFRLAPNFGQKIGPNLSEDFFFCFSLNFGQTIGPSLSETLFVFALHLILAKKSDQISVKIFFLLFNLILGKKLEKNLRKFGAGSLIWGPSINLLTPWKNFSLRLCLWLGYVPLLWCLFHTNLLHLHFFVCLRSIFWPNILNFS